MIFKPLLRVGKQLTYIVFEKDIVLSPAALGRFLSQQKYLLLLLVLYFLTRLINLTLLPLFNDESTYLYWGWLSLHNLYLSLYDGKQPLLMWLFGYAQTWIADPLYAGRLVSVVIGCFSLIGIYELGQHFFSRRFAIFSSLFYLLLTVFVFYDRLALMEGSLCMIGIWSSYFFLRLLEKPKVIFSLLLGLVLGIGLFVKSTAFIFFMTVLILGCVVSLFAKNRTYKRTLFSLLILSFLLSFIIILPLLMQKQAIHIVTGNSRYAYTLVELMKNPVAILAKNIPATLLLLEGYLTPVPFVFCGLGMWYLWRSKNSAGRLLIPWFLLTMTAFIIFTRNPSIRYIVAFLPVTVFFCAYMVEVIAHKFKRSIVTNLVLIVSLLVPIMLTSLLLFSPVRYFIVLKAMTPYANVGYVESSTSGYGVKEVVAFLIHQSKKGDVSVYVRNNSGNPQDAIYVYLGDRVVNNIGVFSVSLRNICSFPQNVTVQRYFISRNNVINPDCMRLVKKYYKPLGNAYIGVYKITN